MQKKQNCNDEQNNRFDAVCFDDCVFSSQTKSKNTEIKPKCSLKKLLFVVVVEVKN